MDKKNRSRTQPPEIKHTIISHIKHQNQTESNTQSHNKLFYMIMPPLSKSKSSMRSLSSLDSNSGGSLISICRSAPTCLMTGPHPSMSLLGFSSDGHLLGGVECRRSARTKKQFMREQAASRSDCVCRVLHPSPRYQPQPNMGGSRLSRGRLRSSRRPSSSSSRRNEEWSVLEDMPSHPEKNDEAAVAVVVEEKGRVRFAPKDETRSTIAPVNDGDASARWYQAEDVRRFLLDAESRSGTANRMMAYAARVESTFNRSTGLTSPRVLGEYLSNPEEVIGIEHMLAGQKNDRECMRRHHRNALVGEMRRQRQEGGRGGRVDVDALAERLRMTSEISAYMAQQRAVYINLLD